MEKRLLVVFLPYNNAIDTFLTFHFKLQLSTLSQFMRFIFLSILAIFLTQLTQAQSAYVEIANAFDFWKTEQLTAGNYAVLNRCNPDSIPASEGKLAIPDDVILSFSDINNDSLLDGLVVFEPVYCDGSSGKKWVQHQVLILSSPEGYIPDGNFFDAIKAANTTEKTACYFDRLQDGLIMGTLYERAYFDEECCRSVTKSCFMFVTDTELRYYE